MRLSRIAFVFLLATPFAFGASKEIQELQRDVAMLQDQVRTMQKDFGDRLVTMQTLVQTTLDGVNSHQQPVSRHGEQVQRRHEAAATERQRPRCSRSDRSWIRCRRISAPCASRCST